MWQAEEQRTKDLVRRPLVGSGIDDSSSIELEEAQALLVSLGAVSRALS
jgi:hypothetical protein